MRTRVDDLSDQLALSQERPVLADDSAGEAGHYATEYAQRSLWMDDNPRNNATLVESLSDRGAAVVTAVMTDQGIKALSRADFDVVITDLGRDEHGK